MVLTTYVTAVLSCPVLSSWREVGYPLWAEEQLARPNL